MKDITLREFIELVSLHIGCFVEVVQVINSVKTKSVYALYAVSDNEITLFDCETLQTQAYYQYYSSEYVLRQDGNTIFLAHIGNIGFRFDMSQTLETKRSMGIRDKDSEAVYKSVMRKIQKLLALSQNNPSAEEAQTALLKAQAIMAEYGLSSAEITQNEDSTCKKEVVQTEVTDIGKTPWYEKALSQIIADNFRCYAYLNAFHKGTSIIFMGLKEDTEIAKCVFQFALSSMEYYAKQYIATAKKSGTYNGTTKKMFQVGFIKGLKQKYQDQIAQNGWGLVLVKDALVEKEFAKMDMGKTRRSNVSFQGDKEAYHIGFERGRAFESAKSKQSLIG